MVGNNQISETEFLNAIEFLIESGIINISSYNCDQNEDRDRNGVPDIIEEAPLDFLPGVIAFSKRFVMLIYHILIFQMQSCLTMFRHSNLQGADFSNIDHSRYSICVVQIYHIQILRVLIFPHIIGKNHL